MLKDTFPHAVHRSAATMQLERQRMHVELSEVIAGVRRTIIRSRALLAQADAVIAREKLPLIAPHLLAWPVLGEEKI